MATAIPQSPANTSLYNIGVGLNQNAPVVNGADWWSQNAPPASQPMHSGNIASDWQAYLAATHPNSTQTDQAGLQAILDPFNQQYGYHAQASGADTINFGTPDLNSVDVLTSGNQWWWHPESAAEQQPGYGGGTLGGFASGSPGDIMNQDPGYQFRLGQGMDAIQKSAAARGTLLTGGTLKGLQRYAQNFASGEFGNVFGRNLSLAELGKPT